MATQNTAANIPQCYYCHNCDENFTVTLTIEQTEPVCPKCGDSFVELITLDAVTENVRSPGEDFSHYIDIWQTRSNLSNTNNHPPLTNLPNANNNPLLTNHPFLNPLQIPRFFHPHFPMVPHQMPPGQGTQRFQTFRIVTNHQNLPNTMSSIFDNLFDQQHGFSIDDIVLNPNVLPGMGGNSIDDIITHLLNEMGGETGPPPTTRETMDSLITIDITKELKERYNDCTVCREEFTEDEKAIKLKCDHLYHKDCIIQWLNLHNTCPTCRTHI